MRLPWVLLCLTTLLWAGPGEYRRLGIAPRGVRVPVEIDDPPPWRKV